MASTFKRKGSQSLQLATILPKTGKRRTLSLHTGQAKTADSVANAVQTLCDELSKEQTARQTVLKVLVEDIFIAAQVPNPWDSQGKVESKGLLSYITEYLSRRVLSPASKKFAENTLTSFREAVGIVSLASVTGDQCQRWYDSLITSVSAATANNRLTCVSAMFAQAYRIGLIASNPCAGIQTQDAEESTREELSDEEIQKLISFIGSNRPEDQRATAGSWLTAIHLARYAGLRLMDAATLKRSNVIPAGDGLALFFVARKTGQEVTVPCLPRLASYLGRVMSATEVYQTEIHLCPALASRSAASLSVAFAQMMERAGIDTGKTEVNGRVKRSKGFHSLRHSFCSSLAKMGVPEDLRALMAGHSNVKTHRGYVHATAENMAQRLAAFTTPKP